MRPTTVYISPRRVKIYVLVDVFELKLLLVNEVQIGHLYWTLMDC